MNLVNEDNHYLETHRDAMASVFYALGNKPVKIAIYLLKHIDSRTNIYHFTVLGIANKFNCSKQTVRKGIHILKHNKYVAVSNKAIHFRSVNGGAILHGTNYAPNIARHVEKTINKQLDLQKSGDKND